MQKRKLQIPAALREEYRRRYIEGMDAATMRELRNQPIRNKIPIETIRHMEVVKHVFEKPSKKALAVLGIKSPALAAKIFVAYIHSMRRLTLLDMRVSVTRAANVRGKKINEEKLKMLEEKYKKDTKTRLVKLFGGNEKAVAKYLAALEQEHEKFDEFLETERFPLQYTP